MIINNIVLTGFMGTGKTTVGKLLASKLKYEFIDTDRVIMLRFNKTIAQIFKSEGESVFRKMEQELALELGEQERLVIATGGGMLLDSANVQYLGRQGKIFCLVAEPDEIIARVSGDNSIKRPLLQVSDPKARIIELLENRKEAYGKFIQINTTKKTPEEICRNIIDIALLCH